jgi:hypothetical protein
MCPTQSPDIDLVQQVLEGTLAAPEALRRVSLSDGWPIQGCTGYLFAVLDPDGALAPYSVDTPGSAFPRVGLATKNGLAWGVVPIQFPQGAVYFYSGADGRVVPDGYSRVFAWDGGAQLSLVRSRPGPHLERIARVGDLQGTIPPRELKVWVPAQPPTRVLYVHDGQDLFGPGFDLPALAGPSTLVVGIDAFPAQRLQEYEAAADVAPDGGFVGQRAIPYADYVQNVVRPLIEAKYGRPARSALLGCGAGGSAALKSPTRFPDTWDLVAGVSGDYGVGRRRAANATLYEQWAALRTCPTGSVYLGVGGDISDGGCQDLDGDGFLDDVPDAPDATCQAFQLQRTLSDLGCGGRVTFRHLPGGERCGATLRQLAPEVLSRLEAP